MSAYLPSAEASGDGGNNLGTVFGSELPGCPCAKKQQHMHMIVMDLLKRRTVPLQ
jgi:hypothetical protein